MRRHAAARACCLLAATLLMAAAAMAPTPPGATAAPAAGGGPSESTTSADGVYRRPVPGAVVRPFEPPATPYGPGHRGVDFDAAPGDPVRSAGPGTVRHAGLVAGVVWVSVEHPDGIVTSYGPIVEVAVRRAQLVAGGQLLGFVAAGGHGGNDDHGLHWGARRDGRYLDPLSLLGAAPRPSLVGPGGWDGLAGHGTGAGSAGTRDATPLPLRVALPGARYP